MAGGDLCSQQTAELLDHAGIRCAVRTFVGDGEDGMARGAQHLDDTDAFHRPPPHHGRGCCQRSRSAARSADRSSLSRPRSMSIC